jgi:hypothetical protein
MKRRILMRLARIHRATPIAVSHEKKEDRMAVVEKP